MKKIYEFGVVLLLIGFLKVGAIAQISCNSNVSVALDPMGTKVLLPANIVSGNVPSGTVLDISSVQCADIGNSLIVTATDPNGNTCTSNVQVLDITPPKVYVKTNIELVLSARIPEITLSPEDLDDGSYDICSNISMFISTTTFDRSFVGQSVPVTLTVTDEYGNTNAELTWVRVSWSGPYPTAVSHSPR